MYKRQVEKLLENDIVTGAEPIEEVEVKWDSTELVLLDVYKRQGLMLD